jgi:Ca2+-binding EF-hand superfamily protein
MYMLQVNYEEFLRVFGVRQAALVMRRVFDTLDKDRSKTLTKDEIMNGVKAENELNLQADKIAAILIRFCKDGRTSLNYEEFVTMYEQS